MISFLTISAVCASKLFWMLSTNKDATNETSARVFPVVLDVNHYSFYQRLERIIENNKRLSQIDQNNSFKIFKNLTKLPTYISNGYELLRLYLLKPLNSKDFQPSIR